MSYLERKTGRSSKIKSLPNYTTAGSYCFFSQCIELNNLELPDFLSFLDQSKSIDENYQAILKFGPLLRLIQTVITNRTPTLVPSPDCSKIDLC